LAQVVFVCASLNSGAKISALVSVMIDDEIAPLLVAQTDADQVMPRPMSAQTIPEDVSDIPIEELSRPDVFTGRKTAIELSMAKDDVDRMATYGNKIAGLSDKLLSLQAGINQDRSDRFEHLHGKIGSLDDRLSAWQNMGAKKFNVVKDQLVVFRDELGAETLKRQELGRTKTNEISSFEKELQTALKAEQAQLRNAEQRVLSIFESKRTAIRDEMLRTTRSAGDNAGNLRRYLEEDVPKLYEMLKEETRSRDAMEKQMMGTAMEEVTELQQIIAAEKKKREDTEEVMLRMMEDAVSKMQGEIAAERRERKSTEQMLTALLQETCSKLRVASKSL